MEITVCVGTFGSQAWAELAQTRALKSIGEQRFVHCHAKTLHEARNACLAAAQTEYVCFVDADDELHPRFFERVEDGTADVRVPAVQYVDGSRAAPHIPRVVGHNHRCTGDCLKYGNWIVIGAVARTSLLRSIGGFRDYPMYEDFDLWVRCWKAGASIEAVPGAIYRAHVRADSRNRAPDAAERLRVHQWIARDNGLPVPGEVDAQVG